MQIQGYLILFGVLAVILLVSYLISAQVYKRMLKANNRWAVLVSILVFTSSFFVIASTITLIVLSQLIVTR